MLMRVFLIFFLLFSSNLAIAEINVSGADAIRNASLIEADIQTPPHPVSSIFIFNQNGNDSIPLDAIQITTLPMAISRIFTWNEVSKNTWPLQSGRISTKKEQLRHIFVLHEFTENKKNFDYPRDLFKDGESPKILDVTMDSIKPNEARINWTTSEFAESLVMFSISSGNYDSSKRDLLFTKNHSITLEELIQETRYYFVVSSTDRSGNSAESEPLEFETSGN